MSRGGHRDEHQQQCLAAYCPRGVAAAWPQVQEASRFNPRVLLGTVDAIPGYLHPLHQPAVQLHFGCGVELA